MLLLVKFQPKARKDGFISNVAVDTGRNFNVHKTFRRRPGQTFCQSTCCVYGRISKNQSFFQRKPFGLTFNSFFQQRTNMREASYYQKYTKPFEPSVYHAKFRNSSTRARAITGERLEKVGWIESHNCHKRLIKYQKNPVVINNRSLCSKRSS